MRSSKAKPEPDSLAAALRGFGPVGLLAIVVVFLGNGLFAPMSAILALAWARLSKTPFADLGFRRLRSWLPPVALGLAGGVVLKLLFKSLLMPALGAPPVNAQFAHLTGNAAALPAMILWILFGAGFGEETIYRGYLFERLRCLLGAQPIVLAAIVPLTSLAFGAVHLAAQGPFGAAQAFLLGLLLGTTYARTKSLWLPIALHASFDLTALALIYTRTERAVATYFFE